MNTMKAGIMSTAQAIAKLRGLEGKQVAVSGRLRESQYIPSVCCFTWNTGCLNFRRKDGAGTYCEVNKVVSYMVAGLLFIDETEEAE